MMTVYDIDGNAIELDGVDAMERIVVGLAFETAEGAAEAAKAAKGKRKPKEPKEPETPKEPKKVKEPEKVTDPDPGSSDAPPAFSDDPIVEAITKLDREDAKLWTQKGKGKPMVKAVEKVLGEDITEAQRDEAWDKYLDIAAANDGN